MKQFTVCFHRSDTPTWVQFDVPAADQVDALATASHLLYATVGIERAPFFRFAYARECAAQ